MTRKLILATLLAHFVFTLVLAAPDNRNRYGLGNQSSMQELESKLKTQYAETEKLFASPPHGVGLSLPEYTRMLRAWQDDLAQSFARAAATVEAILALSPGNREMWQERLETLRLYSQPISSPDQRNVYGSKEVQTPALILQIPLAEYTAEAQAARTHGQVRLRMVLAADGTVKNVFPIKSLSHGLTEAAMAAARQIRFEPALRNREPASEFMTFVYEFDKGQSRPPYIPKTIF
jgi:TonB family protein